MNLGVSLLVGAIVGTFATQYGIKKGKEIGHYEGYIQALKDVRHMARNRLVK